MRNEPPKLCNPCDTLQLVNWQDYINVSDHFSAETKVAIKKALDNLAQTPEFAKLIKEGRKRTNLLSEINTLRGFEKNKKEENKLITIHPARSDRGASADPLFYCVYIPDKSTAENRCVYRYSNGALVQASLEQTLSHELAHLADPLVLIRTCNSEIRSQLKGLLPAHFLESVFTRMPAKQDTLAEKYAVQTADNITHPRFGEPKRIKYNDFIETDIFPDGWKTHNTPNQGLPLFRVDVLREHIDQRLEIIAEGLKNGDILRPNMAMHRMNILNKTWENMLRNIAKKFHGKKEISDFVSSADHPYVQMALDWEKSKQQDSKLCSPTIYR